MKISTLKINLILWIAAAAPFSCIFANEGANSSPTVSEGSNAEDPGAGNNVPSPQQLCATRFQVACRNAGLTDYDSDAYTENWHLAFNGDCKSNPDVQISTRKCLK